MSDPRNRDCFECMALLPVAMPGFLTLRSQQHVFLSTFVRWGHVDNFSWKKDFKATNRKSLVLFCWRVHWKTFVSLYLFLGASKCTLCFFDGSIFLLKGCVPSLREFWFQWEMAWTLGTQLILLLWVAVETSESSIYLHEVSYCMIATILWPTVSLCWNTKSWRVNFQTHMLVTMGPPAGTPDLMWTISPDI